MGRASGGVVRSASLETVKHIPHLLLGQPWTEGSLTLSDTQRRHLVKVLRIGPGEVVTYTDGVGTFGRGELVGSQEVRRGAEKTVARPTDLTVVAAPPASRDRQRYLVEKLAELGTRRLMWLGTRHGKNRVASLERLTSWVVAATEQSRGSWMMEVASDVVGWDDLEPGWVLCQSGGDRSVPDTDTVVVGPEGGFAEDEVPARVRRWDLGPTVLRVETAAVAAVAKLSH